MEDINSGMGTQKGIKITIGLIDAHPFNSCNGGDWTGDTKETLYTCRSPIPVVTARPFGWAGCQVVVVGRQCTCARQLTLLVYSLSRHRERKTPFHKRAHLTIADNPRHVLVHTVKIVPNMIFVIPALASSVVVESGVL